MSVSPERARDLGHSLIEAAKASDAKSVRACVNDGANVTMDAHMALWWSCYNGNQEIFDCLHPLAPLSQGALNDMAVVAAHSGHHVVLEKLLHNASTATKLNALDAIVADGLSVSDMVQVVAQMVPVHYVHKRVQKWNPEQMNRCHLAVREWVQSQMDHAALSKQLKSNTAPKSKRKPKM